MLLINLILNLIILFTGSLNAMENTQTINNFFNQAQEVVIYENNNSIAFQATDEEFDRIINSLLNITQNAHEMPAYGVSIDKDTRDALKTGLWLELKFSTTLTHNEMPFDSLLIEVDSEYSGFNIIRHHDNQYEGRCYYINLEKDMSSLYETIENIL